jgi:hypothetical protein
VSPSPTGGRSEIPTDAQLARQSDIIDLRGKRVDLRLRIIFAVAFLLLVVIQIGIVDRFLWVYAEERTWAVPTEVMIAFLSATVVEVLGVIAIIVKYLFDRPNHG